MTAAPASGKTRTAMSRTSESASGDEAGVGAKTKQIVLSLKAGKNVSIATVRDLVGVLEPRKAQIGVLISMSEPTNHMWRFYQS